MGAISLKCSKCGADLSIDIDHVIGFCPYCGNHLILDSELFNTSIKERGKTQRLIHKENSKTDRLNSRLTYEDKLEKRKAITKVISEHFEKIGYFLIVMVLIIAAIIESVTVDKKHVRDGDIQITASADELVGQSYQEVEQIFKSLGFKTINLVPEKGFIMGITKKDGEVTKVTIDGDAEFSSHQWFRSSSVISIYYYSNE